MRFSIRSTADTIWAIGDSAGRHRVGVAASALTLYILLALVPSVVAFGLIAGAVLIPRDLKELAGNISTSVNDLFSIDAGSDVWVRLESITTNAPSLGVFTASGLAAILVALYSASRVVVTLRQTLDLVFDVPVSTNGLILRAVSAVVSLVFLLGAAIAAVSLLVAPRVLSEVTGVTVRFGWTPVNWMVGFIATGVVVRLLFRYAPHRVQGSPRPQVSWMSLGVWGSAAWMMATSALIGLVIQWSSGIDNLVLIFGFPIILMLWLNTVLTGLLFGSEVSAFEIRRTVSSVPIHVS